MTHYPPETKAQALAELAQGTPLKAVARQSGIPASTLRLWRNSGDAPEKPLIDLGALVLDYLSEALTTLSVQARHFRDPVWLSQQPADQLAILHGVVSDKATRVLAALEASRDADAERRDRLGPGPGETLEAER